MQPDQEGLSFVRCCLALCEAVAPTDLSIDDSKLLQGSRDLVSIKTYLFRPTRVLPSSIRHGPRPSLRDWRCMMTVGAIVSSEPLMLKPVKQKMPTFVNPFRDEYFPHYASLSRWRGFHTTRLLVSPDFYHCLGSIRTGYLYKVYIPQIFLTAFLTSRHYDVTGANTNP